MPSMFPGGWPLVYTDFIATYWFGWIVFVLSYVGGYFVKLRSCRQRIYFGIFFFLPFRKISIYVWTRPETHVSRQEHDSLKHISTQACRRLHTHTLTHSQTHTSGKGQHALPRLTLSFHSDETPDLKKTLPSCLLLPPNCTIWCYTGREPELIPSGLDVTSDTTSENIQHPICSGDGAPIFLLWQVTEHVCAAGIERTQCNFRISSEYFLRATFVFDTLGCVRSQFTGSACVCHSSLSQH